MSRFSRSFLFAWNGFRLAFNEQSNLRFHVLAASLVMAAGFLFNVTVIEWCILLFCIGLVITAELVNSAIEGLVDLVSPEQNEKAGKIKDISAASVLVVSIVSAIVGIIIFSKHFF